MVVVVGGFGFLGFVFVRCLVFFFGLCVFVFFLFWFWFCCPAEYLDECAEKYGEIFRLQLAAFGTAVVISSPEVIKEVFAKSPAVLLGGKSNEVTRPFLGDNSVLVLDGEEHLRQRKLLMPAFHGERMQAFGQTMLDLSDAAIDSWPQNKPFPLLPMLQKITLGVIVRTIFGVAEGPRYERMIELTGQAIDTASNPLLLFPVMQRDLGAWSPWGKFLRLSKAVDEILRIEVEERRAAASIAERPDILSMMVAARDEQGNPMTFQELRDELVTMLVAGNETTAPALAWTLGFLLQEPALCARLRQELGTAQEGKRLVPERIARLELLDATVREGLRLRPVAPVVGRVAAQPVKTGPYEIPAGWVICPSIHLAHRRKSVFPEPERFNPERFLRARPSPNEFLPFGGGTRRCLGAAFATHEMKMVLAAVLSRTSLRLKPGYVPTVQRRGVLFAPKDGVPVIMDAAPVPAPAQAQA